MKLEIERKWLIGGGIAAALIVVAVVVIVLATSESSKSAPSAAERQRLAREGQEAEEEIFGGPTNPNEPRSLAETIIAHPQNEVATAEQLKRQIITNEESADPTHQQEASCSYLSEYGHYTHFICEGYTLGGTSGAIGQIEVTVDQNTGEVSVEPALE